MRPVQDCVSECALWHQRQFCDGPLPVDQRGSVLFTTESPALYCDIVRDDEVKPLGRQLLFRVGNQIAGLGSEANDELCGPLGR